MKLADVADTGSVDSKEEQDTSVDNTCYMKLSSKLQPFIIFSGQYKNTVGTSNNFGTFRLIQLSQILARILSNSTENVIFGTFVGHRAMWKSINVCKPFYKFTTVVKCY